VRCRDHVAVIATGDAVRQVVIGDLPAGELQVGRRQQLALHFTGEIEIPFEGRLLSLRKVVKTVAEERINQQSLGLNRFVTHLAETVAAVVQPLEGRVDLPDQFQQTRVRASPDGLPQFDPPIQELLTKRVTNSFLSASMELPP